MITWVNVNEFSPNLVCAFILWRAGLGLLTGKFCQISACDTSIFSFPDDYFSRYQWSFTKPGICIDIVEIWFVIANGHISSIFDSHLPVTSLHVHFRMITSVNIIGFSLNLVFALILWRSGLELLIGKSSIFERAICPQHIRILVSGQNWVNLNGFSPNWYVHWYCGGTCMIWDCSLADSSVFNRVICLQHDNGGVL